MRVSSSFKTKFVLILIVLLICVSLLFILSKPQKKIRLIYRNLDNIAIYQINEDGSRQKLNRNISSGKYLTISQDGNYSVKYTGKYPYDSGEFIIDTSKDKIVIYPYFSKKKLESIVEQEAPSIKKLLTDSYNNIDMYDIQKGKMYFYGDWYATTLQYKGSDPLYSDSLRIVFQKIKGEWVVATNPPGITLSKYSFPDVPETILRDINNTDAPLDDRFVDKSSIDYTPY